MALTKSANNETPKVTNARPPFLKPLLFCVVLAITFALLSALFTPYHSGTHTRETVKGIYEQPKNSVQVAFFGTSSVLSGLSPDELYKSYGIASYNCATNAQPLMVSCFLLKDLLRTQSKSLSTVVLDPSVILHSEEDNQPGLAQMAIRNMKLSPVKIEALLKYISEYNANPLDAMLPAVHHHSRWKLLTAQDYEYPDNIATFFFSHGQYIRYRANIESPDTANRSSKINSTITTEIEIMPWILSKLWDRSSKSYLDEIMSLCSSNGIDVLFVKIPHTTWNDVSHDSIQVLADSYGVNFLDFSETSVMSACGLSYALDYVDTKHPNVVGASLITRHLGKFLIDEFGVAASENKDNGFDNEQIERYEQCLANAQLLRCGDFLEYLNLLANPRYLTLISVKGDAQAGLTQAAKKKLESLGLLNLADLECEESYVGILDGGQALYGFRSRSVNQIATAGCQLKNGEVIRKTRHLQPGAQLPSFYSLESAGTRAGNYSSINFDEEELSENLAGVNFVVIEKDTGELLDTSCFNTGDRMQRTSDGF